MPRRSDAPRLFSLVRRILVRSVNWVGDAVLTLPALDALAQRFPEAEITVLAVPWVASLFAGQPSVSRVLTVHRAGLGGRLRQGHALAREGFDLAVLLPNSFDAALGPWLAGIPRRVGYATDARRWLLTHAVPPPPRRGRHQVHWYLDLVRAVGAEPAAAVPRLAVAAHASQAADALLRRHGIGPAVPLVAVNPGSVYGGAKRWPAARYATVADRLAERGAAIALVGSRREAGVLAEVAEAMRGRVAVLAGETDLATLGALLRRARLLLTNDTGAMHVASAVGTPVVAIFGPTDAETTAPVGDRAVVIRHPVPCSPCLFRECPIDHRCMTRIPADVILEAAVRAMREPADARRPASEVTQAREPGAESRDRGPAALRCPGGPTPRCSDPALTPPGRAAFLDRDGTIIEDLGYLGDPDRIQMIPGAVEALQRLQSAGFSLILVTNQSGVARGLITEAQVQAVNAALLARLREAGIEFAAVYYCPHHPEYGPPAYRVACECRKPGPGMVRRAIEELGVDGSRSVVIGDHTSDTDIARRFPGMRAVLVRTGHGGGQVEKVERGEAAPPDHCAADLGAAVRWLLDGEEASRVTAAPA